MKKVGYKTWARIVFVLVLLVTIYLLVRVLVMKSPHGIDQLDGIYCQPRETIRVVAMGTSHIHCGVNTGVLWERYGIPAYDYSGAEQPLWMTYHYLVELYKYQSPDVILLDLFGPARFKEDYQYEWMGENVWGMRFSANKLGMLLVSVEWKHISDYFPSFMIYHSRYDDLDTADFQNFFWNEKDHVAFKGYTPYWNRRPQYQEPLPEMNEMEGEGLTEKSEKYLRKIIELTKKNGSELILMVVPYVETIGDRQTYAAIRDIALEEGIEFINFNDYTEEIGLDFAVDFNDDSHLNYWGSTKFTDFLGDYLERNEALGGCEGDLYDSWDVHVNLLKEEKEEYDKGQLSQTE